MLRQYHIELTKDALGDYFAPAFLRDIWRANVQQDSTLCFFGYDAHRHACNCRVAECLAYIDEEQALIAALAYEPWSGKKQRAALGRLLHSVQDIFAHTNYVSLCVWQRAVANQEDGAGADEFDPSILEHPALCVARWDIWREPLYYLPLVGRVLRHLWLPLESHEAINLDSPKRGAYFDLAMAFARQRTVYEYRRAVEAICAAGGMDALANFHGMAEEVAESVFPVERDERVSAQSLKEEICLATK